MSSKIIFNEQGMCTITHSLQENQYKKLKLCTLPQKVSFEQLELILNTSALHINRFPFPTIPPKVGHISPTQQMREMLYATGLSKTLSGISLRYSSLCSVFCLTNSLINGKFSPKCGMEMRIPSFYLSKWYYFFSFVVYIFLFPHLEYYQYACVAFANRFISSFSFNSLTG